jgi:SAM-dependent methyltransferase
LAEFTGERVIPGQVEVDLWNEHVARYAFAARYARGRRVLDAGCGSGYGAVRLALNASSVWGVDVAEEALAYARAHCPLPNLRFIRASCTELPAPDACFDLVVAFEVIEHLQEWEKLLREMARVTAPDGLFLVSTPNKDYYEASRGRSEPNPYHVHEFGFEEFREELRKIFPQVCVLLQNHVDGLAFQPVETFAPAEASVEAGGGTAKEAHFFVAICSCTVEAPASTFIYIPKAANILRERELHIERLEQELAATNRSLGEALEERQKLVEMFRAQTAELEQSNRWAQEVDGQLNTAKGRIADLQQELAEQEAAARQVATGYEAKLRELEQEVRKRTEWALETERRLGEELEHRGKELAECVRLLHAAEATVEERTAWAQRLEAELRQAEAQVALARASRWVRLGRAFGLGPELGNG